jgi:hypothetical protein
LYDDRFQAKNGSVQLNKNEPVIEIVSSISLKLLMHFVNTPLNNIMNHFRIVILIILAIHILTVYSESVSHIRKLYADVFSNYTKGGVMPVHDHSKPLTVGVQFYFGSINSFKEIEETISITGSFLFNWTDPFLAWNPSSYNYMTNTFRVYS